MVYILMVNANMFADLSFLTLAIMPFTYNISYGIAFGLISYIIISSFCACK